MQTTQRFDAHKNNCWHEVKRQYQSYWGKSCPVDEQGENPRNALHIHRGALRLVKHFGLADKPKDGCIVLLSVRNVIHHFGFYKDGLIHTLTESGQWSGTLEQVKERLGTIKYLEV